MTCLGIVPHLGQVAGSEGGVKLAGESSFLEGKSVLVLEDEPLILLDLELCLKGLGRDAGRWRCDGRSSRSARGLPAPPRAPRKLCAGHPVCNYQRIS